jgi:hypothetical protein
MLGKDWSRTRSPPEFYPKLYIPELYTNPVCPNDEHLSGGVIVKIQQLF